jgi:ornithine carbamoyltransferase
MTQPKHFIDDRDLDRAQRLAILETTWALKHEGKDPGKPMAGKQVAVCMSKPSLRTRVSFTVAVRGLGGDVVEVNASNTKLGAGEDLEEWAAVLGRMVDCIVARVHDHEDLIGFREYGGVPVINALSDLLHPMQGLADAFTVWEHARKSGAAGSESADAFFSQDSRWTWLGDGNNVTHSLMLTAASLGPTITMACPDGRQPDPKIVASARSIHPKGDGAVLTSTSAEDMIAGADMVYADTWVSYGQEGDLTREDVERIFSPYRVDASMMARAKDSAIFLHCLPAHTGDEVTADVLRGPQSLILDQAENRLWTARALLSSHTFGS